MTGKYILDENGEPRPEPDTLKWGQWMEADKRRVLQQDHIGGYFVSTIFLGLDHNFLGSGPPVLWETMIFAETEAKLDAPYNDFQKRYTSQEDALAGHGKIVQMLTS
jgi:hypothetical protein